MSRRTCTTFGATKVMPTPGYSAMQQREGARGAAEAEVTAERDLHALDVPELALDRVQVEERLRRVFAGTVTGVDHRDRCDRRCPRGCALLIVAQHDHVGVRRDHADGVLERLALDGAREGVRRLGPEHGAAEAEHRRFEAQPRPRARLVEERRHDAVRETIVAYAGERGRPFEDVIEERTVELLAADDIAESPSRRRLDRHRVMSSSPSGAGRGSRAAAPRSLAGLSDLLEVDAFGGLYLRVVSWHSETSGSSS